MMHEVDIFPREEPRKNLRFLYIILGKVAAGQITSIILNLAIRNSHRCECHFVRDLLSAEIPPTRSSPTTSVGSSIDLGSFGSLPPKQRNIIPP